MEYDVMAEREQIAHWEEIAIAEEEHERFISQVLLKEKIEKLRKAWKV